MLTIILVIVGLSLLVFAHEAGHFFVAKWNGMKVDEFGFGFPPRLYARKIGETEYSVNWLPFGGFVRIAGEYEDEDGKENSHFFNRRPVWRRILVVLAGVAVNFLIGWILISIIFMRGTPQALFISGVEKGSPADAAGFQAGDMIKGYIASDSFIQFVNAHRGQAVSVTVIRGNTEREVTIIPRKEPAPGHGALGVYLTEGGMQKENVLKALYDGFIASVNIFALTAISFYGLIKTLLVQHSLVEGVVGPVGIFTIAKQTSELGFIYFAQLLSIISLNLAAMNLIPFPALDGGRALMIMIEKIKGSPLPKRVEGWINGIGFLILVTLMILLTIRDVTHAL